jgi:hypothetical protein
MLAAALAAAGCSSPSSPAQPGSGAGAQTAAASGSGGGGELQSCGDARCQPEESCSSCAEDCGDCNPGEEGDLGHAEGETTLSFDDATASAGLDEPLDCMMGHAAAFGDIDGDGFPELFFGTFADKSPEQYGCDAGARPDRLFSNGGDGTFAHLPRTAVEQHGRTSGAVFADLDGDGDLDLVTTHNSKSSGESAKTLSNLLLRNDGASFTDVTPASGLSFVGMAARNVIPLDYDGDARIDLFIVGDMFGSPGSRLMRNMGNMVFEDRTSLAGLPGDLQGLGAAVADFTDDGWPDLFVGHADRLYVNDGAGGFVHVAALDAVFAWPEVGNEDWRAGVAFGDVDRDGRLDLVVAHHYGSAWQSPVPVRLYLNRGGSPASFENVTSAAGLVPIASKAPHVEIQDMDNDGWPDIYVSVHVEQGGTRRPFVLLNDRVGGTVPHFSIDAFSVADDGRKDVGYGAAGPTSDYDRDGRLDLFITEWWADRDATLYRNTSAAGNYLEVALRGAPNVNPHGLGARVDVFEQGGLGDDAARIGRGEIASGFGYSSGQEVLARFGLADRASVDLRVRLPHGGAVIDRIGVRANQRIVLP